MLVYEHQNVKIEYDPSKQRLTQIWNGFIPSSDFRKAIDATVDFTRKKPVKTILSDTLNQGVVKPEDTEYAGSAMPRMAENGLKAMAFVIPENIFTQLSLKRFAENEKDEAVQYFKTVPDAHNWLDSL